MQLRYGMNPNQAARVVPGAEPSPLRVLNGEPSYINVLDALNGWQLAREAALATGLPVATSFKHVSPAGAATSGELDATARDAWGLAGPVGPVTSAYVRARDADPKSSFGDMIALSGPVDAELAEFVSRVVSDGILAPGFEPGTVEVLARKKRGAFLVLEADAHYEPPASELRDVFGVMVEQERDQGPIGSELLRGTLGEALSPVVVRDALFGLVTLRYTQSNSVALVKDGAALGIGAGQQNRVDCVKLAAAKARTWWMRRHPTVRAMARPEGISRQDYLNWQIRVAEGDMTPGQLAELTLLLSGDAPSVDGAERAAWPELLDGVTLSSDGFLPFRDNIDHASRVGVRCVVEPGGSSRSGGVGAACAEHGITLVHTGLRLFHH
jgi:phosphoribosylaminoimidazolecarboxamide formyltransferase / IMP cyclohydrolase